MAIELECPKDSLVEDKLLKFSDQAKTCELPSITLAEREKGEKKETKKRPRRMSKLRQDALRWVLSTFYFLYPCLTPYHSNKKLLSTMGKIPK